MGPSDPEDLATELRKQLGIHERSFNLLRLVRDAGIKVVFEKNRENMPAGAEGFSLSSQSGDLIIIDTTRPFKMRLRFTLAHELGHILLGHSCRPSDIHACSREARETDANIFAAALLMPQDLFLRDIVGKTLSLTNLNYLSDLYQVSLTAAAVRFVGLTEEACAVCSFRGADSAWVKKSGAAKGLSIRKYPIKGSLISSHLKSGQASPLAARVPARCWIDSPHDPGTVLREEFIKTSLETALVLLSNLPVGHATAPADSTGDPSMQKCTRAVPAPTDRLKERSNNTGFSHLVATLPGRNLNGQDQNSIGTGLRDLDLLLGGGFQPGKLTLISGRRESGRTSFLLSVARHAALRETRYVAAIMMGHNPEKLQRMIIASETGAPPEFSVFYAVYQSDQKGRDSAQGVSSPCFCAASC